MANLKKVRTDVVGSLLRPQALREERACFDEGKLSAEEMRAREDKAIRDAVHLQEGVGLDVITDGEMRRLNFQDSFGEAVEGFDAARSTIKSTERRVEGASPGRRWDVREIHDVGTPVSHRRPAKERLRLARNVPLEEYEFVAKVAKAPAKVSLIGPDRISQRFDHQNSTGVYKGIDDFVDDVVRIEREIVESLVKAGCRYIHIDAPGFTAYVDKPTMEQMKARGEDPMENFSRSLKAESKVVENLGEVATGIHLCRGNQRSMWHREGTYDAIDERLFNELAHDRFMLEYDTPRAGSFEPLRFVPKGKVVVLGLVSTKTSEMETVDGLKRRIDEATKFIPLDQLAISPQCGFASDVVGNLISADEQKRKLELVVETARQVWG
ncbi:MAG: methionine synthase [Rhizobiales bacterium]|nr:methionine synthase [Hyphomicrobiales bacterium]